MQPFVIVKICWNTLFYDKYQFSFDDLLFGLPESTITLIVAVVDVSTDCRSLVLLEGNCKIGLKSSIFRNITMRWLVCGFEHFQRVLKTCATVVCWWIAGDISDISPVVVTVLWYFLNVGKNYPTLKKRVFYASYNFFRVETINLLVC